MSMVLGSCLHCPVSLPSAPHLDQDSTAFPGCDHTPPHDWVTLRLVILSVEFFNFYIDIHNILSLLVSSISTYAIINGNLETGSMSVKQAVLLAKILKDSCVFIIDVKIGDHSPPVSPLCSRHTRAAAQFNADLAEIFNQPCPG